MAAKKSKPKAAKTKAPRKAAKSPIRSTPKGKATVMGLNEAQIKKLKDGDACTVVAGTHKGKSGTVADINTSKTGHVTITVIQKNGERFKTLARNVQVKN